MIPKSLSFDLPLPWSNKWFTAGRVGAVNFFVGPNGTGKSRFAAVLKQHLGNARLLGTDRLSGMEQTRALSQIFGDQFADGLAKNHFQHFKNAGKEGSGIDTVVLLEERMDLRIQVEATLSHLFNRKILLDWDSGNLIARAVLGESGTSYRLDRDECHGIKELLILLTHLYNDEYPCLIIDEPELNLHPQYQAFFMQEARKYAGDPESDEGKKIIFLVTHSPFILDFRSADDVKSVISFKLDYSVPAQMLGVDDSVTARLAALVPRLNVHHKQLFFSDNPVFVEGVLDAQLVATIQEARGVSVAGAGSCIIDAGGSQEVNKYLELCLALGKEAHFLYDLDSLFRGGLRACIRSNGSVRSFLMAAGVGADFGKYCGELERVLTGVIDQLVEMQQVELPLARLVAFLQSLGSRGDWSKGHWARARVAVMTAISRYPAEMKDLVGRTIVGELQGRLQQIVEALRLRNIYLLPGGTLERYLPSYSGDDYELSDEAKRKAVELEIDFISRGVNESDLSCRYGELYEAVCRLPSKVEVDTDHVLRDYLGRYIHELQVAVTSNPSWVLDQVRLHMDTVQGAAKKVFAITEFKRGPHKEFSATVAIAKILGQRSRYVRVDQRTNSGMGEFRIETDGETNAA